MESSVKIQIPKYGYETDDEKELEQLLEEIDKWGVDHFRISEITSHHPLTIAGFQIFKSRNLTTEFRISEKTLVTWLKTLEETYHASVLYHNSIHGADTVQSIHFLLNYPVFKGVFTNLEILSALVAAAVHDADHPGLTNAFLISTGSDWAKKFNNISPLENHHYEVGLKVFQHEGCNILDGLTEEERSRLLQIVKEMVLSTDMATHKTILPTLTQLVDRKTLSDSGTLVLTELEKIQVLQLMMICVDLGNPTKPFPIYRKWVDAIKEEFFKQGDKERELGLKIGFLNDRYNSNVEKGQEGFIDFVVLPLWNLLAKLVHPHAQDIMDVVQENKKKISML
jgi:cAMP-specific phosphodiesterase 4